MSFVFRLLWTVYARLPFPPGSRTRAFPAVVVTAFAWLRMVYARGFTAVLPVRALLRWHRTFTAHPHAPLNAYAYIRLQRRHGSVY